MNENVKIVFRAYLHKKWVNFHQTNRAASVCSLPPIFLGPFYTYSSIHFTSRNAEFSDNF